MNLRMLAVNTDSKSVFIILPHNGAVMPFRSPMQKNMMIISFLKSQNFYQITEKLIIFGLTVAVRKVMNMIKNESLRKWNAYSQKC